MGDEKEEDRDRRHWERDIRDDVFDMSLTEVVTCQLGRHVISHKDS